MSELSLMDAFTGAPDPKKMPNFGPQNILATIVYSLLIDEKYGNTNGVLHGGATGVTVDMVTTAAMAPLSRPGYWEFLAGVTRAMNWSVFLLRNANALWFILTGDTSPRTRPRGGNRENDGSHQGLRYERGW